MSTKLTGSRFRGAGTALVTPFIEDQGGVDYPALGFLVEQQIAAGIGFLTPGGTTGEAPTLDHKEQGEMIRFVVKVAAGRVPVLAGGGSNCTGEAVALTKAAFKNGADGVLSVMPYYNKPTLNGLRAHYRAIAEVGLPVVLYDIPGRCGGKMAPAELILELAQEGTIHGLKWASGDLGQLQTVLIGRPKGFIVLSGDDNLTFEAMKPVPVGEGKMKPGADGVISVVSNLIPSEIAAFVSAMTQGKWEWAEREQKRLLPLMKAMFLETNPIPVKEALAMMYPREIGPFFRLPLCRLEEGHRVELKGILESYGLIKKEGK